MPKYLIERDIPGAGNLSAADLKAISKKSCDVLRTMSPEINWVHSYVTDDKLICVYISPNEDLLREHAAKGEFPITKVIQVGSVIDPISAE